MRPLVVSMVFLAGCASSLQGPRAWPITLRGLEPAHAVTHLDVPRPVEKAAAPGSVVPAVAPPEAPAPVVTPSVAFAVEPVTQGNWLEHRELIKHLVWSEADTAGPRESGEGGIKGAGSTFGNTSVARFDDVTVLPLPAFRVRIENRSDRPLSFARASATLDAGLGRSFEAVPDRAAATELLRRELLSRHPELAQPANRAVLDAATQALDLVTLLSHDTVLPPGEAWEGWVAFTLTARDADDFARLVGRLSAVSLRISGLEAAGQTLPEARFAFAVPHRPSSVRCADGSRVPSWHMCKKSKMGETPSPDGPCIQETIVPFKLNVTQFWAGHTPIANSDLNRMLLTEPQTHDEIHRGLVYRWAGYAVIAAGIMGSLGASVALAAAHHPNIAPAGIAGLALVPVGAGLAWSGVKHTERAVATYNDRADDTGVCAPVW